MIIADKSPCVPRIEHSKYHVRIFDRQKTHSLTWMSKHNFLKAFSNRTKRHKKNMFINCIWLGGISCLKMHTTSLALCVPDGENYNIAEVNFGHHEVKWISLCKMTPWKKQRKDKRTLCIKNLFRVFHFSFVFCLLCV